MSHSPILERYAPGLGLDSSQLRKAGPQTNAMTPVEPAEKAVATRAPSTPRYLTNSEAAAYLRLSPRTLEKHRVIGGGPRFHKFGRRVMYALADLEAWARERSFETTFDPEYIDRHPGAKRDEQ
ncbi:hypothetical protein SRABI70_01979 [Pseudomonas sp. Bi70]|nr:hypothetical protein SRABI70_01979 [Pseudomonas sp. Bi70]